MGFAWLPVFLAALLVVVGGQKSSECQQCTVAVDLLQEAWGEKATEDCVVDIAIFICDTFHIEDRFICDVIINDFDDEFMWVVKQILVTPHQICGLLMNNNCGNFSNPLLDHWDLPLPGGAPVFQPQQPVKAGNPTIRALHLTDIHVDMYYQEGLEAQCDTPQCCRPQDINNEIVRPPGESVKQPAGHWGTVGTCDAPYYLFTNMLDNIAKTSGKIDYVMISGDLVSHTVWAYTTDTHAAMVRNLSDTIRSYFPGIPVYFAVGNHEGVPIDNFAPHFTPNKFHMDWLYDTMSTAWDGWVPQDQQKQLKYNGCYVKKLFPGLRLLSLNNAYGDSNNFWLLVNQTDPDSTLSWAAAQLLDAEKAGDKVHVVAHIPGANGESLKAWSLNYYKLCVRFANTITAQFFGHTHSESFYMIYADPEDAKSTPTGVVYSAPSLTTYSQYFPAYRIYTIDGNYPGSTYQVVDFEEWYFNLTENNADITNPTWKQLYRSSNAEYGLAAQTPTEYNNLIERMKTDDQTFKRYYENHYRRNKYDGLPDCTGGCRNGFLCSARQFQNNDKLCSDLSGFVKLETSPRKKAALELARRNPPQQRVARKRPNSDKCPL